MANRKRNREQLDTLTYCHRVHAHHHMEYDTVDSQLVIDLHSHDGDSSTQLGEVHNHEGQCYGVNPISELDVAPSSPTTVRLSPSHSLSSFDNSDDEEDRRSCHLSPPQSDHNGIPLSLTCAEKEHFIQWISSQSCRGVLSDSDRHWTHLHERQTQYQLDINPNYLSEHPILNPKMRSICIDWMQQVCQEYFLCRETFHLACNYFDRYLSERPTTPPTRLQLVGVTALFLSGKLEEVRAPCLEDFAFSCAGCYTTDEILCTEIDMVKALKWRLHPQSPSSWARLYLQRAIDYCHKSEGLLSHQCQLLQSDRFVRIMELIDVSRLFVKSLKYSPSMLSAAVLYHVHEKSSDVIDIATGLDRTVTELSQCIDWVKGLDSSLPSCGLDPIANRGYIPSDIHCRQVYHPDALKLYLEDRCHQ